MPKIEKEKIVFDDKLVVEEGHIAGEKGDRYTRLRVNRQDAAAVLILNIDSGNFILTKQFRYAVVEKTAGDILEIVAGKIDGGDTPLETVIREAEEEAGYRIKEENTRFLVSCFTTPGYSSERIHLYFATVRDDDKVSEGGGKEEENESIVVVEIPKSEFDGMVSGGLLYDAKTCLAGLMYRS